MLFGLQETRKGVFKHHFHPGYFNLEYWSANLCLPWGNPAGWHCQKTVSLGAANFCCTYIFLYRMPWARQPACAFYRAYMFSPVRSFLYWKSPSPNCQVPAQLWRSSNWCSTCGFRQGWISACSWNTWIPDSRINIGIFAKWKVNGHNWYYLGDVNTLNLTFHCRHKHI